MALCISCLNGFVVKTYLPTFLCSLTLLFFTPLLLAQNPLPTTFICGGDVMQQDLWKKRPELAAAQAMLDAQFTQVFRQKEKDVAARAAAAPLVLPVVVHIIHNGGSENISDAQVAKAVQHLNDAFAHAGYYAQAGASVETSIQFCLARRTPDGLATTGINRVASALTSLDMETDDLPLKDLSRWDPTRYINIWVVQSINSLSSGPGVAGYAYFPSSHGRPEDGMVCEAQFFGVSPEKEVVFIHEMGHYFGLYHTFEGGCKNDDCLVDGDRVCDTPPDQGKHTACPINSCTTDADALAPNPFTTDVSDMTENFMDYSPFECVYRFTQGQADRMLEFVTTVRKSLLESDGCLDACAPMVDANFSVTPTGGGVAGVTANFNNTTTGGASYQWFVNNALVSTAVNPAYTFNFPGVFSIKLRATNGPQGCVDSVSMVYVVTCPVKSAFTADKTSIKEGESVLFTSTAAGAGSLEWFINGVLVGSAPTLNFTFSTEGTYNVVLRATGAVCSDDFSGVIEVTGDCEEIIEQLQYSATSRLFFLDMQVLPSGNVIACGRADFVGKGAVVLFGPKGNVLWSKASPQVEVWKDVQTLPDGTFALLGNREVSVATTPVVLHLDANGNLLQFFNFNYAAPTPLSLFYSIEQMVVDPDGSLTVTATYNNADLAVIKFRLDGTLLWSKIFKKSFRSDLHKAANSGNGYLLSRNIQSGPLKGSYEVFRLDANGEVLQGKSYHPTASVVSAVDNYFSISPHPDGGYAIACKTPISPIEFQTNLLRCEAGGDIVWSNHYITTGLSSIYQNLAYFKDNGWLLGEQGGLDNNNNIQSALLLRIEEDGGLRWHKKFTGATAGIASWQIMASKQAGRIRLMANDINVTSALLANLPDATGAVSCLTESTETIVLINQHTYDVTDASPLISESLTVTLSTGNLTLTHLPMNKKVLCAAPPPCPEICDNGKDDDNDGYVDCYDPDCHCFDGEDCIANNLDPDATIEGMLAWRTSEGIASVNSSPIVANLNPQTDSIAEIIVIRANVPVFSIYKGDGSNVNIPDRLPPTAGFAWNGNYPVIGDINKDGIPEFITVENDSKVHVYRNFTPGVFPCMTLWITSDLPTADTKQRPMLADFDQDGRPEIYAGNDVFQFDFSNPAAP